VLHIHPFLETIKALDEIASLLLSLHPTPLETLYSHQQHVFYSEHYNLVSALY
jgi:hypothetical protein